MATFNNGESAASVRTKINAAIEKVDGTASSWEISADSLDLKAIAETKAVTAVDVFVYDTSKDSDGGAWRKRTQNTSWYNETLNTATRGSRREFPAVAVIVAESNKVTIYDGDDPSLPMWMVFEAAGGLAFDSNVLAEADIRTVSAVNGQISIGQADQNNRGGVRAVYFISDTARLYYSTTQFGLYYQGGLSERNDGNTYPPDVSSPILVDRDINDVAMTVLPDAPIDPATGLPVPTIAVATDGGVSVIKDDGTVVDLTYTFAGDNKSYDVNIDASGRVSWGSRGISSAGTYFFVENSIPSSDKTTAPDAIYTSKNISGGVLRFNESNGPYITSSVGDVLGHGTGGITRLYENQTTPSEGMVAYTTFTYNTGWMNGDIKGAFLSDTDDTDLVGGTDADRSVNGNDLTVNGTITRTPVATGADLVAYSGFFPSNYLEQPYNSDLDFGTGDFCVMGWVDLNNDNFATIFHKGLSNNSFGLKLETYTGTPQPPRAYIGDSSIVADSQFPVSGWFLATLLRRSGTVEIWSNDQIIGSAANSQNVENEAGQKLRFGVRHSDNQQNLAGSLALWRISATAPTADQIRKIYEDEKFLFQEGAQATLYGSSDAVTALAHDPVTDLLHVGTSAGRSVFQGLRRVENTTDAVGTAISASNNLVVEE